MQKFLKILRWIFSAVTVGIVLLLCWQCLDIYLTGNLPENINNGVYLSPVYSAPIVAERLSMVSPLLLIYAVLYYLRSTRGAMVITGLFILGLSLAIVAKNEFLGLDVLARHELWRIIRALKGNITILLTTHYMEEAEALSDRIAIMKAGRLLICDTADAIKKTAGTDNFQQAFIQIVKGVGE